MKPLREIDVLKDDLSQLNDKAIILLFKQKRKEFFITNFEGFEPDEEECKQLEKLQKEIDILYEETKKRGHFPNKIERKKIRQEKAKHRR